MRLRAVKGLEGVKGLERLMWEGLKSLPSSVLLKSLSSSVSPPPVLPEAEVLPEAGVPGAPAASTSPEPHRQRFYVELKEGETAMICMRELLRMEAMKNACAGPPAGSEPAPESVTPVTTRGEQQPPTTSGGRWFTNVMDRIDGLYKGADTDGEDSQAPAVQGYDTDDSFIDDTELNDYFTSGEDMPRRYSGFYIHRGPFEPAVPDKPNEPVSKKRKRADVKQPARGKQTKPKESQSPAVAAPRKGKNANVKPGVNSKQQAKPNLRKPSQPAVASTKQKTDDVKQPFKAVATQTKRRTTAVKQQSGAAVAPPKKLKTTDADKPVEATAAPKRVCRRVRKEEGGAAPAQKRRRKNDVDEPSKKAV